MRESAACPQQQCFQKQRIDCAFHSYYTACSKCTPADKSIFQFRAFVDDVVRGFFFISSIISCQRKHIKSLSTWSNDTSYLLYVTISTASAKKILLFTVYYSIQHMCSGRRCIFFIFVFGFNTIKEQ